MITAVWHKNDVYLLLTHLCFSGGSCHHKETRCCIILVCAITDFIDTPYKPERAGVWMKMRTYEKGLSLCFSVFLLAFLSVVCCLYQLPSKNTLYRGGTRES